MEKLDSEMQRLFCIEEMIAEIYEKLELAEEKKDKKNHFKLRESLQIAKDVEKNILSHMHFTEEELVKAIHKLDIESEVLYMCLPMYEETEMSLKEGEDLIKQYNDMVEVLETGELKDIVDDFSYTKTHHFNMDNIFYFIDTYERKVSGQKYRQSKTFKPVKYGDKQTVLRRMIRLIYEYHCTHLDIDTLHNNFNEETPIAVFPSLILEEDFISYQLSNQYLFRVNNLIEETFLYHVNQLADIQIDESYSSILRNVRYAIPFMNPSLEQSLGNDVFSVNCLPKIDLKQIKNKKERSLLIEAKTTCLAAFFDQIMEILYDLKDSYLTYGEGINYINLVIAAFSNYVSLVPSSSTVKIDWESCHRKSNDATLKIFKKTLEATEIEKTKQYIK